MNNKTQIDIVANYFENKIKSRKFIVVSPDSSSSFRLNKFALKNPECVIETGIAEASALALAYGLSLTGYKIFVAGFSAFLILRGLEPIRSLIAYHKANVTILGGMSGLTHPKDGYMHQSIEDIGVLNSISNIQIFTPSDEMSLRIVLDRIFQMKTPCYIRLSRTKIDLGTQVKKQTNFDSLSSKVNFGNDYILLSYGRILEEAIKASIILKKRGIFGKVIEVLQVKPFDYPRLRKLVGKIKHVLIVEDHLVNSGVANIISNCCVNDKKWISKITPIGLNEGSYGSSGELSDLLSSFGLTGQKIADKTAKTVKK